MRQPSYLKLADRIILFKNNKEGSEGVFFLLFESSMKKYIYFKKYWNRKVHMRTWEKYIIFKSHRSGVAVINNWSPYSRQCFMCKHRWKTERRMVWECVGDTKFVSMKFNSCIFIHWSDILYVTLLCGKN